MAIGLSREKSSYAPFPLTHKDLIFSTWINSWFFCMWILGTKVTKGLPWMGECQKLQPWEGPGECRKSLCVWKPIACWLHFYPYAGLFLTDHVCRLHPHISCSWRGSWERIPWTLWGEAGELGCEWGWDTGVIGSQEDGDRPPHPLNVTIHLGDLLGTWVQPRTRSTPFRGMWSID